MQRTSFVLALVVLFAGTLTLQSARAADVAPQRSNIVYILADDLGYGDLRCYNAESKIPTPNLDRLAQQGMRFTDAHAPTSVCTPTRYSILTGRYCWRSRLPSGVLGIWGKPLIPATRLTVPSLLKQQGYATACLGKWHLGWDWATKDGKPPTIGPDRLSNVDFTKTIGGGPTNVGFDVFFGVDLPNFPPYCYIDQDRTVGIPSEASRPEFNRPGPMLPGWQWVEIMPEITRRSVSYIASRKERPEPFFLYLPLTAPHYPVVPAKEFTGKSQAGEYGDFVAQVDDTVGRVMEALEKNGLADNTLIVFTSDNGPEISNEVKPGVYDRLQQYQHASMGPLRGAKRDIWEAGHRVPFIARWPGKVPAGATSTETICHVDLMATVAAILGTKLPDNAAEDSYNILPALVGEKLEKPIRPATVHHSGKGHFAIRRGDWVLIEAPTGDDNKEPDWFKNLRGYEPHNQPGELYDLRQDLAERKNLYAEKPQIVSELKELLKAYRSDGRSTPGAPQPNDLPDRSKK